MQTMPVSFRFSFTAVALVHERCYRKIECIELTILVDVKGLARDRAPVESVHGCPLLIELMCSKSHESFMTKVPLVLRLR